MTYTKRVKDDDDEEVIEQQFRELMEQQLQHPSPGVQTDGACPTGKSGWRKQASALAVASNVGRTSGMTPNVFRCTLCGRYHLQD